MTLTDEINEINPQTVQKPIDSNTSIKQHIGLIDEPKTLPHDQKNKHTFYVNILVKLKQTITISFLVAKKEVMTLLRYPWEVVFWVLMPIMWLIPYVFQGQALLGANLQSENFARLIGTSNVLQFIFIGTLMWNILDSAIWGSGNALRWEQQSGTLQYIWLAPISRINLLIGASLGSTVWSLTQIIGQFALLSIFVSWQITFVDALITLLVLVFVIIGLYGFSFAFAAIILVFKEPSVLTEFVDMALYICSPMRYPVQVLPRWISWIAYILPMTWGLTAVRFLLMTNGAIISMLYMVGILIAIDVAFWIGGFLLFKLAEKRTLKRGDLGNF
ncbi:MAG: ABC transporter permease [Candidatus Thorarchaeota archaeon]